MRHRQFSTLFWFGALVTFVACDASAQVSQQRIPIRKEHAKPAPAPPIAPVPPLDTTPSRVPPMVIAPPSIAQLPPAGAPPIDSGDCRICVVAPWLFGWAIEQSHGHETHAAPPIDLIPPGLPTPPTRPVGPAIPGFPGIPLTPPDSQPMEPGIPSGPSGPGGLTPPSVPGDTSSTPGTPSTPGNPGAPDTPPDAPPGSPPPVTATPEPSTIVLVATGFVGVLGAARRRKRGGAS